jgi:hypothetical protein
MMATDKYVAYVARCGCEYTIVTTNMVDRWLKVTVCQEHNSMVR